MNEEYKNRTGTYVAFYVDENTAVDGKIQTAKDLCNYRTLEKWKETSDDFHFINSHDKTFNVKDDSDYEKTLLPRLKERLRLSKNIVILLSSVTRESRALKDEICYAAELGLPFIVIYVDYKNNDDVYDGDDLTLKAKRYLNKLPALEKCINNETITSIHIPFSKEFLTYVLNNREFTIQGMDKNTKHTFFVMING